MEKPARLTVDDCLKLVEDGKRSYEELVIQDTPMNATTQRAVEVTGQTV